MNGLLPNIQAIIATQAQVTLDDVAQLADKIVEVMPPPRVAHVSSSGDDISILTTCIDELAQQVAALCMSPSHLRSPRRHDSTQDIRHTLRDSHKPLTSAGTATILKSVQRDAPCPVRGSRETWTAAVASGAQQLQQLSQPPLCDGSAHKDKFLGRHWRPSLRLPLFPSLRTLDTD
jgi:hypothetical protein